MLLVLGADPWLCIFCDLAALLPHRPLCMQSRHSHTYQHMYSSSTPSWLAGHHGKGLVSTMQSQGNLQL